MSKHTAGPWKGYKNRGVYVGDDQSRPVFETGCGCCTGSTLTQADADLIAAAPDLLDALKLMVEQFTKGSGHSTLKDSEARSWWRLFANLLGLPLLLYCNYLLFKWVQSFHGLFGGNEIYKEVEGCKYDKNGKARWF